MKKRWMLALGGAAAYWGLLTFLVQSESGAPEATITSMGDAFWFSLVTLTTAGYGDCFPVTSCGKLIGVVFLLLSTGFLAFCVAFLLSVMTGKLLPWLRLVLAGKKRWYLFPKMSREAAALAAHLLREEPEAGVVFWRESDSDELEGEDLLEGLSWYWGDRPWEKFLHGRENCSLLFMGPDSLENYTLALGAVKTGAPVYCQTSLSPETLPENLTLFDRWECCARLYWRREPVTREERELVVLGAGSYAFALMEQALLVNLSLPGEGGITWHLFGDWDAFLREHPYLNTAVDIGGSMPGEDRLVLHPEPWNADPALLERAGRILIFGDDDKENLERFRSLTRWFPIEGKIHLRLKTPLPGLGALVFGADEEIFTPELLLRRELDRVAMGMHEIYRASSGGTAPKWEELSPFLQSSNRAAADHLPAKLRLLLGEEAPEELTPEGFALAFRRWQETREEKAALYQELEHRRWMRFYALHGWRYGEKRDNPRRRHPDLRPFGELSPAEQAKDDYAWELLGTMAEHR